jgi:hypothetical protein
MMIFMVNGTIRYYANCIQLFFYSPLHASCVYPDYIYQVISFENSGNKSRFLIEHRAFKYEFILRAIARIYNAL